jgi:hypothetical protein
MWRLASLVVLVLMPTSLGAEPTGDEELPPSSRALGVEAGLSMAAIGGTTPGGVVFAGNYLYRLSEYDWLNTKVRFSLGSGGAACFRDRDNDLLCDHGLLDGFSGEAGLAVRRTLLARDEFQPHIEAGVGVGGGSFSADRVSGLIVPAWLAGGIRARVSDYVHVVTEIEFRGGAGLFGRGIGLKPMAALGVLAGVEFRID